MTNDAKARIEQVEELYRELRRDVNRGGRPIDVVYADLGTLRDIAVDALTSPPAPSGWQQRIAAIAEEMHKEAREWLAVDPANNTARQLERFAGQLESLGQNAKDALPPSSSAWKCKARASNAPEPQDCGWPVCGCDDYAQKVIDALLEAGALRSVRDIDPPTDALPPVSEASPAKRDADRPPCEARHFGEEGFVCTRPRGHSGQHIAHGESGRVWARWLDADGASGKPVNLMDCLRKGLENALAAEADASPAKETR